MTRILMPLAVALTLAGCVSAPVLVAPEPPKGYALGSRAKGSACGAIVMGFIPAGVNGRADRAYRQAVQKGGGDGIVDVTIRDRWYWIYVGELLCTEVEGTSYRLVPAS